jgi:hypothetical protein
MRRLNNLSFQQASDNAGIEIHQWKHFESRGKTIPPFFKDMCVTVGLDPAELLRQEGLI